MNQDASALIQAGAAIVIASFTVALWRATNNLAKFTKDYVEEMHRLNELQEQIVRLQSVELARQAQSHAPSLVAVSGGSSLNDRQAEGKLRIENVGGSAAYGIKVATSWGPAAVGLPLQPGDTVNTQVSIARQDLEERPDKDPIVQGFRFTDPQGAVWEQGPGSAPDQVRSE